jgi:hypothetical protein
LLQQKKNVQQLQITCQSIIESQMFRSKKKINKKRPEQMNQNRHSYQPQNNQFYPDNELTRDDINDDQVEFMTSFDQDINHTHHHHHHPHSHSYQHQHQHPNPYQPYQAAQPPQQQTQYQSQQGYGYQQFGELSKLEIRIFFISITNYIF